MITDETLTNICTEVYSKHFNGNGKAVKAKLHPYRSFRHTVEWNHKYINLKISQLMQDAPIHILESLAIILLGKVYKIKPSKSIKETYSKYVELQVEKIPKAKRRIPKNYTPYGNHYNLKEIFDKLNLLYFSGKLALKYLGWSKNKSYTRLGYFDRERDLLVISQIFDSKKVPQNVVEYLMYHEMLHILIPTTQENGRRKIHTRQFKELDKKFPDYDKIQKWIKKKRNRL